MEAAGFTISGADHPICPVMLGDARLSSQMAEDMLKKGIFVIGFSYPVVPKGKARIRVQISAVHSEEDIDRCVEAFVEVGKGIRCQQWWEHRTVRGQFHLRVESTEAFQT